MFHNTVLLAHVFTTVVLIFLVIRADIIGINWMRGRVETLQKSTIDWYHKVIHYGLWVAISTGLVLFYPYQSYLLTLPMFWVKISFVAILIMNGFLIGRLMQKATIRSFKSLKKKEQFHMFLSGAISTIAWISVIGAAIFIN